VIGVLSDLEVSVVLGFCFCRWAASEPVGLQRELASIQAHGRQLGSGRMLS
jgi:hypothetical protein